jgi:GntR family transcriptional regulator
MAGEPQPEVNTNLEPPRLPMTKQREAKERILALVETLHTGDAIPSERQLSAELGVSRLTIRAALEQLVREGHLVRRQGAGTFVSDPKIAQELTATSFTDDMRRRGMVPSSRTLEFEITSAGARLGRCLHISPSEQIVTARRLRFADAEPMAIETLHVPAVVVPGLVAVDLEGGSFYTLLAERYGIELGSGIQTIEPTVTDEEESEFLHVPLHSPAFLFERTSRARSGQIVEYVTSVYRGDRYRLVAELSPPGTRPAPGVPVLRLRSDRESR